MYFYNKFFIIKIILINYYPKFANEKLKEPPIIKKCVLKYLSDIDPYGCFREEKLEKINELILLDNLTK